MNLEKARESTLLSLCKDKYNDLRKKEGLFIVALSWISISIIAAIPFLFYGFTPINALFEGTSGITTTGATILTNFSNTSS